MEWLPPQGQPGVTRRSRPTTGSPSRSSSISMVRGTGRQEVGHHSSNILLEGTPATAANEASSFRQGGKRPRTTSSIFAAAATGMLTGRVAPTAVATAPSFANQQYAGSYEHRQEALFRLRGHMGSGRNASAASDSNMAGSAIRVIIPDDTAAANASITTTTVFQSHAADAMMLDESSYSEDALGEAAAMAADERRSSPPAPRPECSVGYNRNKGRKGHTSSPQPTLIDDTPERAWSQAVPFDSRAPTDGDGCLFETGAVDSSGLFIDSRHRGSSSPTAPAYEPSPLNEDKAAATMSWQYTPERQLEETDRGSREETQQQQQQHGPVEARAKGGGLADGFGSRTTQLSAQRQDVVIRVQAEVEGDRRRHTRSPQQRVQAISSIEGEQPPSPPVSRQDFLSTMKKSDDAYQSVREDLLHYMEGVRARTSEDGTPSVTFPKNFDRIVGLMGRNELEDQSPDEEAKDSNRSSGSRISPDGRGKDGGKGQAKGAAQGDRPPPWTKYLLEEGLDRTKAFSRYKGMFADEQTGEDRVMRGLAKMRELDLRLARTTERARELKIMARQAAEQAERAAAGVATENKRTSPRQNKGRGPVAVEDVTTNQHSLRLLLPLSSEPAPFGAISSRVSNGSARQMKIRDGGGAGLRTDRSEMSAASESQPGADGVGSSSRAGHAKGGRAFVTQNFRGAGRNGSSSHTGSASASVDGSENLTGIPAPSSVLRRSKNKFDGPGDGASRGRASSGGGNRGSTSSSGGGCGGSGGSSGVSFVLKNKRHAAKANRHRLTDEQESLVSRFLQDADGFNEEGKPTGEQPSGVWAEITPYGGAGATNDAARLAEINAQLLAIGGVVLPDCDEELEEENNTVQEREQRLSRPAAADSERTGVHDGDQGKKSSSPPPPPPPPPPPSRSRAMTGPAATARDGTAPGEAALREQRERREARYKERAIDNALEQLRDSLFQNSAAGGRNLREEAVDTALEIARSAPLNMQRGIRQGVGRIDSLLGGEGPQPVGEWEVKHALRQGEQDLRGKDLASREKIEELLVTVRQQSAADSRCASLLQLRDDTASSEEFPKGATLDAVFSLTGAVSSDAGDGNADILPSGKAASSASKATAADSSSPSSSPCSAKRGEATNAVETARKLPQQADGNMLGSKAPLAKGSRSAERARPSRLKKTETAETATSTTAGAEGPSSAPRPRPRLPRKRQPSSGVPPELAALFRAPLLVPRHLDPPVAGIAAAAVAAGGVSRVKPGKGVISSDR